MDVKVVIMVNCYVLLGCDSDMGVSMILGGIGKKIDFVKFKLFKYFFVLGCCV